MSTLDLVELYYDEWPHLESTCIEDEINANLVEWFGGGPDEEVL